MKKILHAVLSYILIFTVILSVGIVPAQAKESFPSETNPFGETYYIEKTNQKEPFFEVILPKIAQNLKANNKHSINPYFDKLPKANNSENFQGLGSTTYANINGKKVTAEAFYRVKGDSLHDPNAGMGLMLYQCIQYKIKHPKEDVKITFSYYRTSASAAVCVLPQSKYYGYMRSLYTTNYDEHGFVRISYMLAEAARMGIEVTMVNHLPSYDVKQYNPATKKLKKRTKINYVTYFEEALKTDCYKKYAPGKKVSDFMDSVVVGWTVKENNANMQHVKSCTVSHYLATDGSEHRSGVFFTTSNLDENNYVGANGNGLAQSGVIISDHDDLYRVTVNYMHLMQKYPKQAQLQTFRNLVVKMNREQMALIRSGKGNKIPADEQIVYLGTKNDPVFELYYTPLGNEIDTWDAEYNPICEHVDKLVKSEDFIEFAWNEYAFQANNLGVAIGKKLEQAFCGNPNKYNKFSVNVTKLNVDKIKNLKLGTQLGSRHIADGTKVHAKDFLMSYVEDGVRHNVSIMTSCNFVKVGFHDRTNSILVIDETAATGGNFYGIIGEKFSDGMIHKDRNKHTYKESVEKQATLKSNGKTLMKCACGAEKSAATVYRPKTIQLSETSYTYNKKTKTPSVTVKDTKGKKLVKGKDYDVAYESGRKQPGKYSATVTFKGKYSGEKKLYFKIKPKAVEKISAKQTTTSITLSWKKVTGAKGYRIYQYNKETKKYEKVKTVSKTSYKITELTPGTKYKFKVRAYMKDDGNIWGDYSNVFETATKPKTPSLKKVSSPSKGKAELKWSNVSGESGFQVYYSTKKDGGFKKLKSYKKNVLTAEKTDLKRKKTYYFKVRAYTKTDSGTVYSGWSSVKSVKIK